MGGPSERANHPSGFRIEPQASCVFILPFRLLVQVQPICEAKRCLPFHTQCSFRGLFPTHTGGKAGSVTICQ